MPADDLRNSSDTVEENNLRKELATVTERCERLTRALATVTGERDTLIAKRDARIARLNVILTAIEDLRNASEAEVNNLVQAPGAAPGDDTASVRAWRRRLADGCTWVYNAVIVVQGQLNFVYTIASDIGFRARFDAHWLYVRALFCLALFVGLGGMFVAVPAGAFIWVAVNIVVFVQGLWKKFIALQKKFVAVRRSNPEPTGHA
jgi:hypothetical protein